MAGVPARAAAASCAVSDSEEPAVKSNVKRDPARLWTGVATVIVLLVLWSVADRVGWVGTSFFPSPGNFWSALQQSVTTGYADGRLWEHLLQSVKLILMGFLMATAIGVPLGLWMGWSRKAEALINPIFLLIRPIPGLAWIPLAIVWLGVGDAAKIMILWLTAFVPTVINSFSGVRGIERPIIEASRMLGIRGFTVVKDVIVPGALPSIFTGLRLSLQGCLTALVAAELLGAILGLGKLLYQGGLDIYPGMILVGMVAVAITGLALTALIDLAERYAMPWRHT
jgi:NitT/TauT family transport system permease protein/taurine transport system permease protein